MSTEPILRVRGLSKHFAVSRGVVFRHEIARLNAVDDVSFEIQAGTTFGLVGESGWGKSTLAKCIVRLLDSSAGTIEFMGDDITKLSARAFAPQPWRRVRRLQN